MGRTTNGDWRDGFRTAVIAYITSHGSVVGATDRYGNPSVYGWQDFAATDHIRGRREAPCPLVVPDDVQMTDACWSQFTDTEADNEYVNVLVMSPVSCTCGKYKDIRFAVTESTSTILDELLKHN